MTPDDELCTVELSLLTRVDEVYGYGRFDTSECRFSASPYTINIITVVRTRHDTTRLLGL